MLPRHEKYRNGSHFGLVYMSAAGAVEIVDEDVMVDMMFLFNDRGVQ
jgi:hypothetical protein